MAGRGPAPKPAGQRKRRNKTPPAKVVEGRPVPQPPLPDGFPWPERTRAWWTAWGYCPQAALFTVTDWEFLADTALLHATAWASAEAAVATGGTIDTTQHAELRLRVAKFGATIEDRARLRVEFADPADPSKAAKERGSTMPRFAELTDRRAALEALRDHLAAHLDTAVPAEAAGLAGRLVEVLRELDSLPAEGGDSIVDQIAQRRERRRAGGEDR